MKMRYLKSIVMVTFLLLAALFVLDSCSTGKTATRKANANIAANAPDYKRIKKEINSKNSEFYYPELLRRFEAVDTTMTIEHLRYIYYGAATLPDYSPYGTSSFKSELEKAMNITEPTQSDWENALSIVNKQLAKDPASLTSRFYKLNISVKVFGEGSKESIDAYNQLTMLFYAILSTGDGQSEETAFYITSVSDEYTFMNMIGFRTKAQALVHSDNGQSYDVMDIVDEDGSESKLYFNITVLMESLNKMFK